MDIGILTDTLPDEARAGGQAAPDNTTDDQRARLRLETLEYLSLMPVGCRLISSDLKVLWQSPRLIEMVQCKSGGGCCDALGLRHNDLDCLSARTIRLQAPQHGTRWLGRLYIEVETVPVQISDAGELASFEIYRDISAEKKLQAALIRQQELLETINRSMIEINHHLESAQFELEEKNRNLEEANEQLRSLDHLKDDFISIVSHELKAPLTSIKASVTLITGTETDKLSPTGVELLTVCRRSTDRLHRLVEDLLDVTRIESGRLSLGFTRFSLREMISECFQSVAALAQQKNIELVCGIPPEIEITADRDRLIQVIVNLVNNAIKFTDQGSVSVDAVESADKFTFHVRDTGIGIPDEAQQRIFDKFAQVAGTLHRNTGGTGLGLAIVRGIVREHGGDIHVTSWLNIGSCFTFTIPQPPGKEHDGAARPLD
ncbi:MAG: sensor histidine kinase [Calditrichota bacterium]